MILIVTTTRDKKLNTFKTTSEWDKYVDKMGYYVEIDYAVPMAFVAFSQEDWRENMNKKGATMALEWDPIFDE